MLTQPTRHSINRIAYAAALLALALCISAAEHAHAAEPTPPKASLDIQKVAALVSAVGEEYAYAITVTNVGATDLSNLSIFDDLALGLLFKSVSISDPNGSCTDTLSPDNIYRIVCNMATLGPGAAVTMTILVEAFVNGAFENYATASANQVPTVTSNTTTTQVFQAGTPFPKLNVTLDGPSTAAVGDQVEYTVAVENTGTGAASNTNLRSNIPDALTFVSATASSGGCIMASDSDNDGRAEVLCNFGAVDAGTGITAALVFEANAAAAVGVGASIGFFGAPGRLFSDIKQTVISAAAQAQLSVEKSAPTEVVAGSMLAFTLTVTNGGSAAATNVQLTDLINNTILSFSNATGCDDLIQNTDNDDTLLTCSLGTIPAGQSKEVVLTFSTTTTDVVTEVLNRATATSDNSPDAQSNTTTTTIQLQQPGLSITKRVLQDFDIYLGGFISYVITVTNTGNVDLFAVRVEDAVPNNILSLDLEAVEESIEESADNDIECGATSLPDVPDNTIITCELGKAGPLAPGKSKTFTLIFDVIGASEGDLKNRAKAIAGNLEVESEETSTPINVPKLTVSKQGPAIAYMNKPFDYTLRISSLESEADIRDVRLEDVISGSLFRTDVRLVSSNTGGSCDPLRPDVQKITCRFDRFKSNGSAEIRVTVTPRELTIVENVARVVRGQATISESLPVVTNIKDAATLTVSKEGPTTANVGKMLSYTITVTNTSSSDATGVELEDLVPAELTYSDHMGCDNFAQFTGLDDRVTITCAFDSIPAGTSKVVTLNFTVNETDATEIDNTVKVISDTARDVEDTATTAIPSLSIEKSTLQDFVYENNQITYTIVVSNSRTTDVTNVELQDIVPNDILRLDDYLGCTGLTQTPTGSTTLIRCPIGTIPAGGSESVVLVFTVKDTDFTEVTNSATATYNEGLEAESNSVTTEIRAGTALGIELKAPPLAGVGDFLEYTFDVTNGGAAEAVGVQVATTVDTQILSYSSQNGCDSLTQTPNKHAGTLFTCGMGELSVSDENNRASLIFVVQETQEPSIQLSAMVTADNALDVGSSTLETILKQPAPNTVIERDNSVGFTTTTMLTPPQLSFSADFGDPDSAPDKSYTCYKRLSPSLSFDLTGGTAQRVMLEDVPLQAQLLTLDLGMDVLYSIQAEGSTPLSFEYTLPDNIIAPIGLACGREETLYTNEVRTIGLMDEDGELILDLGLSSIKGIPDLTKTLSEMVNNDEKEDNEPTLYIGFFGDQANTPTRIEATSPMEFTSGLTLEGLSMIPLQKDATDPIVIIDGSNCMAPCNGITFRGGASRLSNIGIENFPGYGVVLADQGGDIISGAKISNNARGGLLIDGTDGNVVGGMEEAANVFSGNGGPGVTVTSGTGNTFMMNTFVDNEGLGIDLGPIGVESNDVGDGDTGANGLQNHPMLTRVVAGGTSTVAGELVSTPETSFTLAFYASDACDASGYGEGARFLGLGSATTDASGNATFTTGGLRAITDTEYITATATGPEGTSEFGPCIQPSTSVATEAENVPTTFALHAPFPNPFSYTTTLTFDLPEPTSVTLRLFDVLGHEINTLTNNMYTAGRHSVVFDASDLASGIYFVRLETSNASVVQMMTRTR